ncbi:MAG: HEPN domain-containing protein [Paenibacillaceae bacterium]
MLTKAQGSYSSASTDLDNEIYDRAVSSLYYSAFQTVTALMLLRGIRSKSHTHVRSYINNELIKKGHIPIELGKMYNKLMDMRGDADYSDTVTFTRSQAEELCEHVKEFNQWIITIINKEE